METLYLPRALFAKDFEHVYEPAEDTFILLDALENDLNSLKNTSHICLECGSGSGAVITSIAKSFQSTDQQRNGLAPSSTSDAHRLLLATDINPVACHTTQKCATYFGQEHNVQVIQTDLAESLVDRLENSVDLLVFNPPYVPTDQDEMLPGKSHTGKGDQKTTLNKDSKRQQKRINLAWAGGRHGRQVIDIFLKRYVQRLLSKPNGVAYMVALEANKIDDLKDCLRSKNTGESDDIVGSVALKRRAGSETLYVLKYQHNASQAKN